MLACARSPWRLARGLGFAAREQVIRLGRPRSSTGLGVVVVPGFGCADQVLALTTTWLRSRGYRPTGARIGLNLGCTTDLVGRLEARVAHHVERTGRRIVLVGHSRGGWLSRMLAVRRPDLVRALVTVGSPVLDPLGANPRLIGAARLLTRLSTIGIPGLLDDDCFTGPCFQDNTAALTAPLPEGLPALAVYSRTDRIAPWELCRDPYAECVEVSSGHAGLLVDPDLYAALEPRLARWAEQE